MAALCRFVSEMLASLGFVGRFLRWSDAARPRPERSIVGTADCGHVFMKSGDLVGWYFAPLDVASQVKTVAEAVVHNEPPGAHFASIRTPRYAPVDILVCKCFVPGFARPHFECLDGFCVDDTLLVLPVLLTIVLLLPFLHLHVGHVLVSLYVAFSLLIRCCCTIVGFGGSRG